MIVFIRLERVLEKHLKDILVVYYKGILLNIVLNPSYDILDVLGIIV